MKTAKKILRHKPETRRTINEISSFIGSGKSAEMLDQIVELKNRTIEIISDKLNDPKYDHWYFYQCGVDYNHEIITICHRYRINYINKLEEKRHAECCGDHELSDDPEIADQGLCDRCNRELNEDSQIIG